MVEEGKEVKEMSGEKAGGGKAMHLCAAKCKPRGECRQKGVGSQNCWKSGEVKEESGEKV